MIVIKVLEILEVEINARQLIRCRLILTNKKKITIIRIINQQVRKKKKKKKNQDFKFEKKTLISFGRLGKFSRDYN